MFKESTFAIVGCGIGGATVAALLQKYGYRVTVYEQAVSFVPAGTGIHITPNAMKVLRQLGVEPALHATGFQPPAFVSRAWDTGEVLFDFPLQTMQQQYAGSYLTIHRGNFHSILIAAVTPGTIHYNKRLKEAVQEEDGVTLFFEDGTKVQADYVIGADGIYSAIRKTMADQAAPAFTGQAAFRAIIPAAKLRSAPLDGLTKWWGHDRSLISYFLSGDQSLFYFAAGVPAATWEGRAHREATREELLDSFAGFHPAVQDILLASEYPTLWPLFERPAVNKWYQQRIVLLGDACHPMMPHMAQGAVMAIEDAAVLLRCLEDAGNSSWQQVVERYATTRKERIETVQLQSAENKWLKAPMDPGWVFSYDALLAPLA
ncbi:FAD-dependent oxidoreductase [Chitinophaga nivalis]|uniref:FAD-dependent monooxygenase n=1 Tax=Chitinophaga nivalis TaxID=2991709 RepID=A0ABT3II62_9BACT|nr:NAD(P)/FAD-dependent oxidoreductase [Chitinophaga nivalis]MCW3466680.1 FAD-dependent monooxygenase [Chitinophaga nivalis]MCW3483629.1 FAD-dependent monooxygenase [Chitinophaga nivalis]